jgi:hypothetical protein
VIWDSFADLFINSKKSDHCDYYSVLCKNILNILNCSLLFQNLLIEICKDKEIKRWYKSVFVIVFSLCSFSQQGKYVFLDDVLNTKSNETEKYLRKLVDIFNSYARSESVSFFIFSLYFF